MNEEKAAVAKEPFFLEIRHYGFKLPVYQTLFTAGASGGTVAALILTLAWFGVPIPEPFKVSISAGVLVFFVMVLIIWPRFLGKWMAIVERVTNRDLNGDGVIGEKPRTPKNNNLLWIKHGDRDELRVMHVDKNGNGEAGDIPYREYLPALVDGLLRNRDFTQREWAKDIPKEKFEAIQRAFVAQGLAEPKNGKNGNNGYRLTTEGVETCMDIVDQAKKDQSSKATLPYFTSQQVR